MRLLLGEGVLSSHCLGQPDVDIFSMKHLSELFALTIKQDPCLTES
jgi:hypothetical protein